MAVQLSINAIYNDIGIPNDYKGNPLIEALPPIYSYKEITQLLSVEPIFSEEERYHSKEFRIQYLQRLFDFFQPLDFHLSLERKIAAVIRQGYIPRNPLDKDHTIYMNNSYKLLMEGKLPPISKNNIKKRVQGFNIIGMSGTGKTTGIDRILNIYPQSITHNEYKNNKLFITQLPWIKLECPVDGSTKGLCLNFFRYLDDKLNTNYMQRYSNKTQDFMLTQMSHLARLYNVGLLIVDEIQHLSLSRGPDKMLNFFVTLVNSIGVPVILIGTNKTFELLNEFRQARRGAGQGTSIWNPIKKDLNWIILLKKLFKYQWVQNPLEFNNKMSDILFEESQGIIDVAVKIYTLAQMEAIINNTERITEELIKYSVKKHLSSLSGLLRALREKDTDKVNKYQDMKMDIDGILYDYKEQLELDNYIEVQKELLEEHKTEIQKMLSQKLSEKILDSKIIIDSVKQLLKKYEKVNIKDISIDDLYKQALDIAESKLLNKKKKNKEIIYQDKDLRLYKEKSNKSKQSVYDLIKENNVLINPYNFFVEKGEL